MQRLGKDCRKQYSNCRGGRIITKIKYLFLPLSVSIGISRNVLGESLLKLIIQYILRKNLQKNINLHLNPTSM